LPAENAGRPTCADRAADAGLVRLRAHGDDSTISVAAPAMLSAIFAAAGSRIRSIPLMHYGVRTA
jgi:hypothetical protein